MLLLMISCLLGGKDSSSSGDLENVTLSMKADCVSAVWSCCVRLPPELWVLSEPLLPLPGSLSKNVKCLGTSFGLIMGNRLKKNACIVLHIESLIILVGKPAP